MKNNRFVLKAAINKILLFDSGQNTIVIRNGKKVWKHGPHVAKF